MKRLLLATLVVLTAAPALPTFAKEPPRCEHHDARGHDRGQRSDCPRSPARHERQDRQGARHRDDHRAPRHAPQDDRRAHPGRDWRPGQTYKGHGPRVDHRRADLPAPARGQHWIRDGERYLLVSDGSGIIRHVMARALR